MVHLKDLANSRRALQGGFTLLEVMIVVIIVGVLMAVSLPGYQSSMEKGRRADAKSTLLDVANRQESFLLDNDSYTDDLTDLGFASDPLISEEEHYSLTVAACATSDIGRCYTITAAARAESPQSKDDCGSFILESSGEKSVSGSGDYCW